MTDRTKPDPDCEDCRGTGDHFGHAAGCRSDYCALAGGIYDCDGVLSSCPCWDNPDACITCCEYAPPDAIAKGWRSLTSADGEAHLRCVRCEKADANPVPL